MLWIAAPRPAVATASGPDVVLVAGKVGARSVRTERDAARRVARYATTSRSRVRPLPPEAHAARPSLTTDTWVQSEDLYLRHLAILC